VVTETDGVFEVGWRHQLFGSSARQTPGARRICIGVRARRWWSMA